MELLICFIFQLFVLQITVNTFIIPRFVIVKNEMRLQSNNNVKTFIKVKRLQQLLSSGKNYTSYIDEKLRYSKDPIPSNDSEVIEKMKLVTQYIHNKQDSSNISNSRGNLVGFLPDCSGFEPLLSLNKQLFKVDIDILEMPNIQDFNTKRYEKIWLDHMRSLNLSFFDIIICHGTSSEAMLRYLETNSISSKRIILINPTDLYTAGERHGRSFHYSYIEKNSNSMVIICTKESLMVECDRLYNSLRYYNNDMKYFIATTDQELTILLGDSIKY